MAAPCCKARVIVSCEEWRIVEHEPTEGEVDLTFALERRPEEDEDTCCRCWREVRRITPSSDELLNGLWCLFMGLGE